MTAIEKLIINDTLIEIGPETIEKDVGMYAYLEFKNKGRILNVVSDVHTKSKFENLLGVDNCQFYILLTTNLHTKKPTAMIAAFGEATGQKYALNMEAHGAKETISSYRKLNRLSYVMQGFGLFFIILGVPALLVFVGIPMIGGGIFIFFQGIKMRKAIKHGISTMRALGEFQGSISNIKYL